MSEFEEEFHSDFGTFQSQLSPMAVSGAIRQMLGLCWMILPPEEQSLDGVHQAATGYFERVLEWWGSVANLPAESMSQRLTDGLDIHSKPLDLAHLAELSLRQGMFCCWLLLPGESRKPVTVARLVAQILERNLAEIEKDFRLFGSLGNTDQ